MCGACVYWVYRTNKYVTLSTSEAEYVALGDALRDAISKTTVGCFMLFNRWKQSGRSATLSLAKPGVKLKFEAH